MRRPAGSRQEAVVLSRGMRDIFSVSNQIRYGELEGIDVLVGSIAARYGGTWKIPHPRCMG